MPIYDCEYDVRVVSKRKHNQPCIKLATFSLPIHILTSYVSEQIEGAKHVEVLNVITVLNVIKS